MPEPDPLAITIARLVREREQPELTILFGSRARGDHSEQKSDIDVLLIDADEPAAEREWSAALAANETAASAYGRRIPVQLIWRTLDEFRHHRRYVNSVETNAIREGVIMPRNPGDYRLSNYEDDDTDARPAMTYRASSAAPENCVTSRMTNEPAGFVLWRYQV